MTRQGSKQGGADRAVIARALMRVVGMLGAGAPEAEVIRELVGIAGDLGATITPVSDGFFESVATRTTDDVALEACRFVFLLHKHVFETEGTNLPLRHAKQLANAYAALAGVVNLLQVTEVISSGEGAE